MVRRGFSDSFLEQNQERIQDLIDTYGSSNQLLLKLAEEAKSEKETQEKIENLVPLPDGVDGVDSFIKMYEEKQAELTETNDRKTDLLIQRANVEKEEPEINYPAASSGVLAGTT